MRNKLFATASMFLSLCVIATMAHAAPDLSSPIAAAKSFTMAMLNGDAQAAQDSVIATPEQSKALGAMTHFMATRKKLIDAAVAKWGADGERIDMQSASQPKPEEQIKKLDEAEVKIDGDTATITPKTGQPQHLKKVDGQWKLDLSQSPNMKQMVKASEQVPVLETLYTEMTADVQADKFKTLDDAQKAMMGKLQMAMMQMQKQGGGMAPAAGAGDK